MKNGEFVIDKEKGTVLFFQKYHDTMVYGESKCHEDDNFNVIVGQLIAMKRCELKIRKQEIQAVRSAIEDLKLWRKHSCEIGQERLIEHYMQYSNEVLKNHLNHVRELKSDIKKLEENTYTLPENAENLKYEYINGSMKLVPRQYAICKVLSTENKWNWYVSNGKYLCKQWFDDVWNFENGYAKVQLDNKYNWIDTNGKLVSKQWYDNVTDCKYGYTIVKLNDKWNLVDTNRKLVSPNQWFD